MTSMRKMRRGVFAGIVAAALGFGAHEALADGRDASCASPSIGTCGTRAQCLKSCAEAFPLGDVVDARCTGGCCYCQLG